MTGGITAEEQELIRLFTPEIIALSERGIDSVLVFHMLKDLNFSDPSSHDIDALEEQIKSSISKVSFYFIS